MKDTTIVLTSCNRPDLLKETLDSFFDKNSYDGIGDINIIDDSLHIGCNDFVKDRYDYKIKLWYNKVKLGQVRSIDLVYQSVKTPYIFHMEEDWKFLRSEFIEKSKTLLEYDEKIITVWLRSPNDKTLKHPYSSNTFHYNDIEYRKCESSGIWKGFTFNPSLKRLKDYKLIQPYHQLPRITAPEQSGGNPLECDISVAYGQLGYYAVTLLDQYIEHIGWGRHLV